ncbi:hypothetical protein E1B28_002246 [Marasmius oreades]|uniref:Uncharacterized protein n=1 Tax=Marasmius oreades TaxID=181124 RepID=A0A9P7UKD5_9AGAR|nr:uncharacterized protein E1B28_002246 [Marasmius oreades]KAG7086282.1 hypothetical protein E1B28_002246 [Marasmius oreades]
MGIGYPKILVLFLASHGLAVRELVDGPIPNIQCRTSSSITSMFSGYTLDIDIKQAQPAVLNMRRWMSINPVPKVVCILQEQLDIDSEETRFLYLAYRGS